MQLSTSVVQDFNGIPFSNIYYMLSYAIKYLNYNDSKALFSETFCATDVFYAKLFIEGIEYIYSSSSVAYKREIRLGETPTGRVELDKSIAKGVLGSSKIYYSHSYRSNDTDANRLILCAVKALIYRLKKYKCRKYSRECVKNLYRKLLNLENKYFSEITEISIYEAKVLHLDLTDYTRDYRTLLELAIIVVKHCIFNAQSDTVKSLVNDNKFLCHIFEEFVRGFYASKTIYNVNRTTFKDYKIYPQGETDATLTSRKSDIVYIIDAKWSRSLFRHIGSTGENHKISTNYNNQIVTYCVRYKCEKHETKKIQGILLCAKPLNCTVDAMNYINSCENKVLDGLDIEYCERVVDLTCSFDKIEAQLLSFIGG